MMYGRWARVDVVRVHRLLYAKTNDWRGDTSGYYYSRCSTARHSRPWGVPELWRVQLKLVLLVILLMPDQWPVKDTAAVLHPAIPEGVARILRVADLHISSWE